MNKFLLFSVLLFSSANSTSITGIVETAAAQFVANSTHVVADLRTYMQDVIGAISKEEIAWLTDAVGDDAVMKFLHHTSDQLINFTTANPATLVYKFALTQLPYTLKDEIKNIETIMQENAEKFLPTAAWLEQYRSISADLFGQMDDAEINSRAFYAWKEEQRLYPQEDFFQRHPFFAQLGEALSQEIAQQAAAN